MAPGAVARPEPAAADPEIPGERGQAGDGAPALPSVLTLVHRAAAQDDHGGTSRGVATRERDDALRGEARDGRRPCRRVPSHVLGQRLEADGVARHEVAVVTALADDHVHQGQREGGIGSWPEPQDLIRLGRGLGGSHVDGDDVGATTPGRREVAAGIGLAGEIGSPEEDQPGVLAHVLLRVGLEHAGEPEPEGAEPPADDGRVPPLAAVEVGEAAQQMRADPRPVVVGEETVACPESDRLASRRAHSPGD